MAPKGSPKNPENSGGLASVCHEIRAPTIRDERGHNLAMPAEGNELEIERQMMSAIAGPLKGLAYIVFLPLIGICATILLGIRKLISILKLLAKLRLALRGNDKPRRAS
ncbi:hypothetical protein ACFLYX_04045 [Chloroflexota bacterium]